MIVLPLNLGPLRSPVGTFRPTGPIVLGRLDDRWRRDASGHPTLAESDASSEGPLTARLVGVDAARDALALDDLLRFVRDVMPASLRLDGGALTEDGAEVALASAGDATPSDFEAATVVLADAIRRRMAWPSIVVEIVQGEIPRCILTVVADPNDGNAARSHRKGRTKTAAPRRGRR